MRQTIDPPSLVRNFSLNYARDGTAYARDGTWDL